MVLFCAVDESLIELRLHKRPVCDNHGVNRQGRARRTSRRFSKIDVQHDRQIRVNRESGGHCAAPADFLLRRADEIHIRVADQLLQHFRCAQQNRHAGAVIQRFRCELTVEQFAGRPVEGYQIADANEFLRAFGAHANVYMQVVQRVVVRAVGGAHQVRRQRADGAEQLLAPMHPHAARGENARVNPADIAQAQAAVILNMRYHQGDFVQMGA